MVSRPCQHILSAFLPSRDFNVRERFLSAFGLFSCRRVAGRCRVVSWIERLYPYRILLAAVRQQLHDAVGVGHRPVVGAHPSGQLAETFHVAQQTRPRKQPSRLIVAYLLTRFRAGGKHRAIGTRRRPKCGRYKRRPNFCSDSGRPRKTTAGRGSKTGAARSLLKGVGRQLNDSAMSTRGGRECIADLDCCGYPQAHGSARSLAA